MNQLNSTEGPLQVPDGWLPPNHAEFWAEAPDTEECIVNGVAKPVTRKTGRKDDGNEVSKWVEYWLDVGEQVPKLIHRSADVKLKPQAVAQSDVGRFA